MDGVDADSDGFNEWAGLVNAMDDDGDEEVVIDSNWARIRAVTSVSGTNAPASTKARAWLPRREFEAI